MKHCKRIDGFAVFAYFKMDTGRNIRRPHHGNHLSFTNLIALFYRDLFDSAIDRNTAVFVANHHDFAVTLNLAVKKGTVLVGFHEKR